MSSYAGFYSRTLSSRTHTSQTATQGKSTSIASSLQPTHPEYMYKRVDIDSVNLQNDLKRYLQAGATDAKNIRERYIGRRADRFRLPSDYQRSCSNRQLIKSNYKQRAPSAAHPVLHCPSTNPFAKVTISNHPTKSSSTRHTLFESVKSRLEFKNQAKDCEIIERIESKPQRQTGADEASGMHTQSKHTLEKWNSGYCQIMSPEKKCEQFLSPAVLKTRLSQHDR